MPAANPIVQGVHVAAYGGEGGGDVAAPSGGAGFTSVIHAPNAYRNPMVALMVFGLLVLILFGMAGFKFVVSASAGR
jgi:hypothetical protein